MGSGVPERVPITPAPAPPHTPFLFSLWKRRHYGNDSNCAGDSMKERGFVISWLSVTASCPICLSGRRRKTAFKQVCELQRPRAFCRFKLERSTTGRER